jgi:hypothetical protein
MIVANVCFANNMVIFKTDGSRIVVPTDEISNIIFLNSTSSTKVSPKRTLIYSEDFESYRTGSLPTGFRINYNGAGNSYQVVQIENNNKFFQTMGTNSWGLTVLKEFAQDFPKKIEVEWKMQTRTNYSASDGNREFANVSAFYVKNADELVKDIHFGNKGNVMYAYVHDHLADKYYSIPINRNEWVQLSMIVDFNKAALDIYVEDQLLASNIPLGIADLSGAWNSFKEEASIMFHSGNLSKTITLFDDIKIYSIL